MMMMSWELEKTVTKAKEICISKSWVNTDMLKICKIMIVPVEGV